MATSPRPAGTPGWSITRGGQRASPASSASAGLWLLTAKRWSVGLIAVVAAVSTLVTLYTLFASGQRVGGVNGAGYGIFTGGRRMRMRQGGGFADNDDATASVNMTLATRFRDGPDVARAEELLHLRDLSAHAHGGQGHGSRRVDVGGAGLLPAGGQPGSGQQNRDGGAVVGEPPAQQPPPPAAQDGTDRKSHGQSEAHPQQQIAEEQGGPAASPPPSAAPAASGGAAASSQQGVGTAAISAPGGAAAAVASSTSANQSPVAAAAAAVKPPKPRKQKPRQPSSRGGTGGGRAAGLKPVPLDAAGAARPRGRPSDMFPQPVFPAIGEDVVPDLLKRRAALRQSDSRAWRQPWGGVMRNVPRAHARSDPDLNLFLGGLPGADSVNDGRTAANPDDERVQKVVYASDEYAFPATGAENDDPNAGIRFEPPVVPLATITAPMKRHSAADAAAAAGLPATPVEASASTSAVGGESKGDAAQSLNEPPASNAAPKHSRLDQLRARHEVDAELAIFVPTSPRMLFVGRDPDYPRYFHFDGACDLEVAYGGERFKDEALFGSKEAQQAAAASGNSNEKMRSSDNIRLRRLDALVVACDADDECAGFDATAGHLLRAVDRFLCTGVPTDNGISVSMAGAGTGVYSKRPITIAPMPYPVEIEVPDRRPQSAAAEQSGSGSGGMTKTRWWAVRSGDPWQNDFGNAGAPPPPHGGGGIGQAPSPLSLAALQCLESGPTGVDRTWRGEEPNGGRWEQMVNGRGADHRTGNGCTGFNWPGKWLKASSDASQIQTGQYDGKFYSMYPIPPLDYVSDTVTSLMREMAGAGDSDDEVVPRCGDGADDEYSALLRVDAQGRFVDDAATGGVADGVVSPAVWNTSAAAGTSDPVLSDSYQHLGTPSDSQLRVASGASISARPAFAGRVHLYVVDTSPAAWHRYPAASPTGESDASDTTPAGRRRGPGGDDYWVASFAHLRRKYGHLPCVTFLPNGAYTRLYETQPAAHGRGDPHWHPDNRQKVAARGIVQQTLDFVSGIRHAAAFSPAAHLMVWEDDCHACTGALSMLSHGMTVADSFDPRWGSFKMGNGGSGMVFHADIVAGLIAYLQTRRGSENIDVSMWRYIHSGGWSDYISQLSWSAHRGLQSSFKLGAGPSWGRVHCTNMLDKHWGWYRPCDAGRMRAAAQDGGAAALALARKHKIARPTGAAPPAALPGSRTIRATNADIPGRLAASLYSSVEGHSSPWLSNRMEWSLETARALLAGSAPAAGTGTTPPPPPAVVDAQVSSPVSPPPPGPPLLKNSVEWPFDPTPETLPPHYGFAQMQRDWECSVYSPASDGQMPLNVNAF